MITKPSNFPTQRIAQTMHRAPTTTIRERKRFGAWPDRVASPVTTPASNGALIAGLRARRARFKCRKRSKLATDTVRSGVMLIKLPMRRQPLP